MMKRMMFRAASLLEHTQSLISPTTPDSLSVELSLKPSTLYVILSYIDNFIVLLVLVQGGHKPGKPGILRDFSENGKLREFSGNYVQPQGKIVTNKVLLVHHSNICVKPLLAC